jgi:hypothetical protein
MNSHRAGKSGGKKYIPGFSRMRSRVSVSKGVFIRPNISLDRRTARCRSVYSPGRFHERDFKPENVQSQSEWIGIYLGGWSRCFAGMDLAVDRPTASAQEPRFAAQVRRACRFRQSRRIRPLRAALGRKEFNRNRKRSAGNSKPSDVGGEHSDLGGEPSDRGGNRGDRARDSSDLNGS